MVFANLSYLHLYSTYSNIFNLDQQCSRYKGVRDNLGIISHISTQKRICDPSLEPSHQDGSNEGSQHMFLLRNKKKLSLNYPQYPLLSGALDQGEV